MNKNELITAVSKKTGLTKVKTGDALDAILETITVELERGEGVSFLGFGAFKARKRAARKGRNPRTKQEITIPERIVPDFKPSIRLKERVNAPKTKKKR